MPDLWYSIAKDPIPPPPRGIPSRRFLTSTGVASGVSALNGNYATPTDFYYTALARYDIHNIIITISDATSFGQSDYGAIPAGLTNGISFWMDIPGVGQVRLLTQDAIKANLDWYTVTAHTVLTTFSGNAQTLVVDIEVNNDFGIPLTMFTGYRLIIRLNDDFTGLIKHTCYTKGIQY